MTATEMWARCPGCGQERCAPGGVVVDHRRYHSWTREMVQCEGSGEDASKQAAQKQIAPAQQPRRSERTKDQ